MIKITQIKISKRLVALILLGSNYCFLQNDKELNKEELDNPLAKRWSLVLQKNYFKDYEI